MTIISNSFAPACRQLLPKYTISTLQSVDIADNQHSYRCILKIFQISDSQEQASINAFSIICLQPAPDPYRASAAICVANL